MILVLVFPRIHFQVPAPIRREERQFSGETQISWRQLSTFERGTHLSLSLLVQTLTFVGSISAEILGKGSKKETVKKRSGWPIGGWGPPFFTNSLGQGLDSQTLDIYLGTCNSGQKTNKIENQRINCEICCRSRHEHIRGFLHLQLEH